MSELRARKQSTGGMREFSLEDLAYIKKTLVEATTETPPLVLVHPDSLAAKWLKEEYKYVEVIMIEKYEVSGLLLNSVVQAFEEVLYQMSLNDWEIDFDDTLLEELREVLAGPGMTDDEEADGEKEEGASDEVEACATETPEEEVPA